MELKITKDKVLAAAAKCGTAKATLETLFPEAFQQEHSPIVPQSWRLDHPKGEAFLAATIHKELSHNHIWLNTNFFQYDLVFTHGGHCLKVTPK